MNDEKLAQAKQLKTWRPHGSVCKCEDCTARLAGAAALEALAAPAPDDAELSAWEALCEKAVDGPWKVQRYSNYEGWAVYSDTYGCVAERWEADAESNARPDRAQYFDAHSKLIAASRTALPRLITALRAARKREGEAVELLRHLAEYWNRNENDKAMSDACWHTVDECEKFLAARETAALNEGAKNG